MKTLAVTAMLLTLTMSAASAQKAAAPVEAKVTLLGEVRDSVCDEVSISPNEKLLACSTLKPDFRIIDLVTHKITVLFKGMFAEDLFWSRAGDRIAFSGREEGSDDGHAWAVGVDPRTGQQTSAPRRLSATIGGLPAFSPDGQLVTYVVGAFTGQRKLVVAPANGGAERVLVEGAIFGPFAWSADGRWIYYPQSSNRRADSVLSIFRVSSTGGTPQRVVEQRALDGHNIWTYHGLSRDARFFALGTRPGDGNQLKTVLDPQGKILGIVSLSQELGTGTSSDYDWMPTGPRLFQTELTRATTLRALSVAGGKSRDLVAPSERPRAPSWSPDGRRFAVQLWNGARFDIAIMNADGTGKRLLHTMSEPAVDSWSPDGRLLAYTGVLDRSLHVIDLASGKDTRLLSAELRIPAVQWSRDSRSIRAVVMNGSNDKPHAWFHVIGLDGQDRIVRDGGLGAPGYAPVDEDWVLRIQDGALIPFGQGEPRRIHDQPLSLPGGRPRPAVSRDGRLIVFMPNGLGSIEKGGVYNLVSNGGQSRSLVQLPPGVQATTPLISPDNRFLVVPTPASAAQPARILLVPINGDAPRTLVTLAANEGVANIARAANREFAAALSPDGNTLLYLTSGVPVQQFFSVDLSPALAVTQAGTPRKP